MRQSWNKLRVALSRLPQRQDEAWELDLRLLSPPPGSEAISPWMLVALNATADQEVHFDFFDDRPTDKDVWSFLITAFREPQGGEPRIPAAISVSRKTWFRSWRSKLGEIGVDCQFSERLDQLDRWFQTAMPQLEKAQRATSISDPADADWSDAASLPQCLEEVWQADVQQLPVWLEAAGEPTRPWISLVTEVDSEAILATAMSTDETPDGLLFKGVWQALFSPAAGEPHRPGVIQVSSDQQREMLVTHLERLGVRCVRSSDLRRVRSLIDELAAHLGGPQRKALIDSPDVTPTQLSGFFEAAAYFYRARPWREIPGDCVVRVACERFDSGPWYAVVMGQSGIEQGLALYEDPQLLRTLLSGELSDEENGRRTSAISVTYGEAFELAPLDVDAAEKDGWPVAGPEAYPCVLRVNPGMALRTPLKWELELLEGALRTIPEFLRRHQTKAAIPVTVGGDSVTFQLERLKDGG
jgi:hypothetical protein